MQIETAKFVTDVPSIFEADGDVDVAVAFVSETGLALVSSALQWKLESGNKVRLMLDLAKGTTGPTALKNKSEEGTHSMTRDEITRLAMRDAETESPENLRAASGIYNRLIRGRKTASTVMVQDDISGTPLPNGMLLWFDFEWADLPGEPLLRRGDPPRWVGTLPGFTFRSGISDAKVTVETDGFEENGDCEDEETTHVTPKGYIVTVEAHGLDHAEVFTYPSWHEVQQRCRRMEQQLDESHMERHDPCEDMDGNLTPDACLFCERGLVGG